MNKEQKLNEQVNEQRETITKLSVRVGQLADRVVGLEGDVSRFKERVSDDVKGIVEHLKKNR